MTAALRILIVEDSADDALIASEQLADAARGDLTVSVVQTLADARRRVEAEPFDCVLLDLSLPDAFGLQGVEALRDARPDVPVVVLTGYTHDRLAAEALRAGAQDYLVKGETPGPVLLRAVRHAIQRKLAERRLATMAMSDALTGLPNRALLVERARAALDRLVATGRPAHTVGVLFLDLDRFKLVNDSLGHAAGDDLLIGVARRLRATVRAEDTVARFGGDEFAVLCDGLEGPGELAALAARVAEALTEPIAVGRTAIRPSASIGVAIATGGDDTPERLLREADAAMYRAKAGAVALVLPDADDGRRALHTEAELHSALRRGELVLHYLPVVGLGGGDVCGVEALVRWHHPERGLVGPDEFIGAAEDSGLIRQVGAWVLQEGCRQLAAWDAAGIAEGLTLSVNLSGRQLDDDALVPMVASALCERGLAASRLCVEVGEGALRDDGGSRSGRLRALKNLGVRVAIDARIALAWSTGAAGAGLVPVDVLKLDRAFVGRMDVEPHARRIVTAVLGLARSMGVRTVAEGIEDAEQARELAALGCELGQGHAFAPAAPAIAIEPLLALAAAAAAAPAKIRVFLCDDAPALRHLLRSFLEFEGDVEIVGEAGDGEGLTPAVRAARADVVLLDLSMPRVDGLEALADLRAADPDVGIVVLSGFEPHRMEAKALALGADRYLEKATGMDEVRATVRAVAAARRGTPAFAEVAP